MALAGVRLVRRQIFIAGVIILALGAILIAYGQISRGQIESVATARDWDVTWYHVTDQFGGWGAQMGTQTLSTNFHLTTVSYSGENLHLGFKASTTFELTQDRTINFIIGSDDGSILYVDGVEQINMWLVQGYLTRGTDLQLTEGVHRLEMWYYQWEGGAQVSFEYHLSGWQESVNMMVVGAVLLAIGAVIAMVGRVLKSSEEKAGAGKAV